MPKPTANADKDAPDVSRDRKPAKPVGQSQAERAPNGREQKQIDQEDHLDRRETLSDSLD